MILALVYTLLLAFIFALVEIQIEGKDGWAVALPTWRKENGLFARLLGRPVTGYFVYMQIFVLLMFHLPLFFVLWTLKLELLLLGLVMLFWLVEDFLWFAFNPHFGVKKFKKENIWWHPEWWGPVPRFYWISIVLVLCLLYLSI